MIRGEIKSAEQPPKWLDLGVTVVYSRQKYVVVGKPILKRSPILGKDIFWVRLQRKKWGKTFYVPVSSVQPAEQVGV